MTATFLREHKRSHTQLDSSSRRSSPGLQKTQITCNLLSVRLRSTTERKATGTRLNYNFQSRTKMRLIRFPSKPDSFHVTIDPQMAESRILRYELMAKNRDLDADTLYYTLHV